MLKVRICKKAMKGMGSKQCQLAPGMRARVQLRVTDRIDMTLAVEPGRKPPKQPKSEYVVSILYQVGFNLANYLGKTHPQLFT